MEPRRIEQRNGRIDRKLQPAHEVRCHYFVLPQRVEDRVLEVLVRKTETIKRELGSLSQVIDDDSQSAGSRAASATATPPARRGDRAADLDAERKRVAERSSRQRASARTSWRRSSAARPCWRLRARWVRFDARPFRDALSARWSCSAPSRCAKGATRQGRPSVGVPGARRARGERPELGRDARHAPRTPQDEPRSSRTGGARRRSARWSSRMRASLTEATVHLHLEHGSRSGCSGASARRGSSTTTSPAPAWRRSATRSRA